MHYFALSKLSLSCWFGDYKPPSDAEAPMALLHQKRIGKAHKLLSLLC